MARKNGAAPDGPRPLDLKRLYNGMKGLTPIAGKGLAEAASKCFADLGHEPGITLKVLGDYDEPVSVIWPALDSRAKTTYADCQEATEYGACGVAVSLLLELEGLEVLSRSWKGTGFDYWVGLPEAEEQLFQGASRLEVSGTRDGDDATLRARVRQKLNQTKKSDESGLPALIAVVDFKTPRAHVERR